MKLGRQTGSACAARLAAAALCLSPLACRQPVVGERSAGAAEAAGTRIEIEDAWVDLHGHVVATFQVTEDDVPLGPAEALALGPRFTLAVLTDHPSDGLRAWKSQLLTGFAVATKLPLAPPGDSDRENLSGVRQPGYETPASLVDLGDGRLRYVFANAVTAFDPDETLRVGVWLASAPAPSAGTSATFDFRPDGGPVEARDAVLDENCARCHGTLVEHGSRSGVRLCLTCHTWQAADPDTIDPASTSTTATTDPNPLELGRLVHRIHRGKELPTLYQSSSTAVPAPALGAGNDLPLPFSPENSTTPLLGRKYSVVGYQSAEHVYGRVLQRADNGQSPKTMAVGVVFPRDLRDCAACHENALQGYVVSFNVTRRTCSGCHPDVWFGAGPIADAVHVAHAGGPQDDDAACKGCHVGPAAPKLYAPIVDAHVAPHDSPRYNSPRAEIVRVENLVPGGAPRVVYRLVDRVGPIAPKPSAPVPAMEPDHATSSLVPRKLAYLFIRLSGPTSPDYGWDTSVPIASGAWGVGNPDPLQLSTVSGTDEYVYTFTSTLPPSASGTWAVAIEGRRARKMPHYEKGAPGVWDDRFRWPYTGETVTETLENALVYVDTATGVWPPDGPTPRRTVVSEAKCLRCHGRLSLHGGLRDKLEFCLVCHTARATDWAQRPKSSGKVNLAATWDGVEERSVHFKVMIHRIHTGGRTGAASLEAIEPHVVYGYGGNAYFLDEGIFPGDLRRCTLCHEEGTYEVEAVPAGASRTFANESALVLHAASDPRHGSSEAGIPPIQAACTSCHATGATLAHADAKTVDGVETCAQCHAKGPLSVKVAHGLAPPSGGVGSSFSSIVQGVLVPRCATAACHSGSPPVAFPALDADVAYDALVGVPSLQSSLKLVEPGAPEQSYLVYKLRGDAASVGGSVATPMPTDGLLDSADIAAIEEWIANGAQND